MIRRLYPYGKKKAFNVTYDDGVRDQVEEVKAKSKIQCVDDLLRSGSTWEVK